jgi:hypothetical protein
LTSALESNENNIIKVFKPVLEFAELKRLLFVLIYLNFWQELKRNKQKSSIYSFCLSLIISKNKEILPGSLRQTPT